MDLLMIKHPRVLPRQKAYTAFKRFMDIALCILSLPLTLPVMLACAVAIRLEDPNGPVFFTQDRVGKGGRMFRIIKFRSMKVNLDDSQCRSYMRAYVKGEVTEGDNGEKVFKPITGNQILRVGRIMRKTSLDELPQIINVLRGEMSIIGPRPNVPWEVDVYRPWHHERLEVLPGITGLAQVRGRSSINFNSLVRYDIAYIEQQSLQLDLKILWWTFMTILRGKGAC